MDHLTETTEPIPFGLRRRPFQPTADPDFFFPGSQAGDALERLLAALRARRGVCVLTGDTGTGKTTLLRTVLVQLAARGELLPVGGNAPMGLDDLIGLLPPDPTGATATPETQLEEVTRRLRQLAGEGRPLALAIDEAQALGEDMLGHVTGLLGGASGSDALGALLLVGQPNLVSRLKPSDAGGPEIAVHCSLGPLPLQEVGAYITHRLRQAGGETAEVFTPEAVERIAHLSGGAPRFVNLLCHESLAIAARQGAARVIPDIVDGVAEDLAFPGFVPRPRLPVQTGKSSGGPSRLVLWAGLGAVAAVAASLVLLAWLPGAIRPVVRAPEAPPPASSASSGASSPATGAPQGSAGSSAVDSPPDAKGTGLTPASPIPQTGPADAAAMGPPSPQRSGDAPSVQSGEVTPGSQIARTSPDESSAVPTPRARGKGQALLARAENRDVPGVLALLNAGESPNASDQTGVTPLMLAAIHGDPIMSDALLLRGASVNATTRTGQTALMMAAINNNLVVAQRLLERGAAVDARTKAGWTALTYAAWEGNPDIARLLLERGADPSLKDRDGWTAQRYAAWRVNPPPPESGGPVTGIDNVAPALRAHSGHAAVFDLLTEAARRRRDQPPPARRKPDATTAAPTPGAPSSPSSTRDGYPLDSSGRGHGLQVPHRGEP